MFSLFLQGFLVVFLRFGRTSVALVRALILFRWQLLLVLAKAASILLARSLVMAPANLIRCFSCLPALPFLLKSVLISYLVANLRFLLMA